MVNLVMIRVVTKECKMLLKQLQRLKDGKVGWAKTTNNKNNNNNDVDINTIKLDFLIEKYQFFDYSTFVSD